MSEHLRLSPSARRPRLAAIAGLTFILAALGLLSLYGQASGTRVDLGFTLADADGRILLDPDGPAGAAGLHADDRLLALEGRRIGRGLDWNRDVLERRSEAPVRVDVVRDGRTIHALVTPRVRRGGDPLFYYLALVGCFFLVTATLAVSAAGATRLSWLYYAFSVSVYCVLALSDTPAGTTSDWLLYLADRFGRLSFGPLFCLMALGVARFERRVTPRHEDAAEDGEPWSPFGRLAFWLPPSILGAAALILYSATQRGALRDPLGLWQGKDRLELLMAVGYIVAGLVVLGRATARVSAPQRRYALRWAFWGALVGLAPLCLLELLPLAFGASPPAWAELSALTLIALPLTMSTALFRLRPGDLELYVRKAVGSLSVLFLTFAVFGVTYVLLDRIGGTYLRLGDWLRPGLAALVAAVLYPEVRTLTHQAIDRLVYGGRSSFRRTLLSFGRELNAELDLNTLVARLQDRTRETLDLETTLVLVRETRNGVLRPVGTEDEPAIAADSVLLERIRGVSYLLLEDLRRAPGAGALDGLARRGIHYLFPMKVEGDVRAILATGPRRGGGSLNTEDIEILVAVCGHAAIALESARLIAELGSKIDEVESLRSYNENILESSRIGILVVQGEVIQAMNRALEEIYGAPREDAVGRRLGEIFPLPFVHRLSRRTAELAEGETIRRLYRYPLTNRRGKRIVVNVSVSSLVPSRGADDGHVITVDDVTDQVRMEEQLLRQERLASIGLLAAGVAHEVNTPLTGISSYAQLLLSEMSPSDPRAEILRKIERQTFRASSIVHSLLNFTRDGAVGIELIRVPDLIEESLALFEPQLRGRRISIDTQTQAGLPPVPGNRGKLQQVLLNLLLNARDAIGDSGEIRLSARGRGDRLCLEIADDGEGIAEEDLGKIFDPFFTTKPRGRGTGLGLSLSYTIIQEHKGEISVESRRGEGAVFTVSLPFAGRDAVHA